MAHKKLHRRLELRFATKWLSLVTFRCFNLVAEKKLGEREPLLEFLKTKIPPFLARPLNSRWGTALRTGKNKIPKGAGPP